MSAVANQSTAFLSATFTESLRQKTNEKDTFEYRRRLQVFTSTICNPAAYARSL